MPSRRLPWIGLALLLAAAFAGCLASDGSGGAGTASSPTNDTSEAPAPTTEPGSQGTEENGTAQGNATAEDGNTTWRNQTRTGQFGGARVVFGVFGDSETFPVSEDAVNLTLVVRAPDAELSGSITPPCDSGGTFGCPSEGYETASGRYTHEVQDPDAGDWTVTFFRDEGGAGVQRYILEIHREVQVNG